MKIFQMFGKSVLAVSCLTVAAGVWVTSASAKMTLRVAYSSIPARPLSLDCYR